MRTIRRTGRPTCVAGRARRWPARAVVAAVVAVALLPRTLEATSGSPLAVPEPPARQASFPAASARPLPRADFGAAEPSAAARTIADWALATDDPDGLPFLIVDKRAATLYVFDAQGRLSGSSPVLLGQARGDDSVPGIGERAMSQIRPHERTTPAGRFVAERGVNLHGEDILWVDYDHAVSMHRVRATNPKERRLERLRTPTIDDNRISYGCINVPVRFYERRVMPAFDAGIAVVYVLPETRPLSDYFDVAPMLARPAE